MSTTKTAGTEPTVPQILRAAREAAGYTQRQMAALLGVSQQTITGWETGVRKPTGEDVFRYLRACGVQTTMEREDGASPIRYKSSTSRPPVGITRQQPVTATTTTLAAA